MLKTKKILLTFIVVMMIAILSLSLIACNNDNKDNGDTTETESELLSNGTFTKYSGDNGPYTVTDWTGAAGSTSSSSTLATPSDSKSLAAGIVSTESKNYKKNKSNYGDAENPGKKGEDDNVLMIYNKVLTAYSYSSTSVSLSTNKFYKFSVWVKTVGLEGKDDKDYGAYIYMNGVAYAGFRAINTNGEWLQYQAYIASSETVSGTISFSLGLGQGNKSTGNMTKGYAYFDDAKVENLTDVKEGETAFTQADFEALKDSQEYKDGRLQFYDVRLGDAEFDYASSTTSTPYTAKNFTGIQGYGSGESAPSSSTYLEKGILDVVDYPSYTINGVSEIINVSPNGIGNRMLFIQNKSETAYGFRTKSGLAINSGDNYYKITIDVKTKLLSGKALVMLSNGNNGDENAIKIKDIDTNGEWHTYTFYIAPNEYTDNTLYLEMWLGFGGKDDVDSLAKGAAFFDHMTYTTIDKDTFDAATASADTAKSTVLTTDEAKVTSIDLTTFKSTQNDDTIPSGYTTADVVNTADYDNSSFKSILDENPKSAVDSKPSVLIINNNHPISYSMSNVYITNPEDELTIVNNSITINPNTAYKISMWIKTDIKDSTKGLTISLNKLDESKKFAEMKTSLTSLSNLNSENLTAKDAHNGYTQVSFYILGAEYEKTKVSIDFVLGEGSGNTSSKFVSGFAFISAASIEEITYSQYTSASSGTTTATTTLVSNADTQSISSNGKFSYMDLSETENTYSSLIDENNLENTQIWANGQLQNYPAVPTNWTSSKSAYLTDGHATAGIIDLKSSHLMNKLGLVIDTNTFYSGIPADMLVNVDDYPTCLYIKTTNATHVGYTSNSITLNANSYYAFSVWAKSTSGKFSIELAQTTNTNADDYKFYEITPANNEWNQYFIFVKTGVSTSTVKLSLYAGNPKAESAGSAEVFFNFANYVEVSETVFNNADSLDPSTSLNALTTSWLVDSFDEISSVSETVSTPSTWTGAKVDTNSLSSSDDYTAGVFDKTTSDWSCLDLDPTVDDKEFAEKLYSDSSSNIIGNRVLAIYNKEAGAYGYSSTSSSLTAGKFYEISIYVLTKDIAHLDPEKVDTSDEIYSKFDKDAVSKLMNTATLTLKVNNKTYTFGNPVKKDLTSEDFETAEDYALYQTKVSRQVNVSEWTKYSYYLYVDSKVTTSSSATLTIALGQKVSTNWESGYVFADNYTFQEIPETDFITAVGEYKDAEGNYISTLDSSKVATNHKIIFTEDDATAEEETTEEETEEEEETNKSNQYLWIYITTGVISVAIAVILIIYFVKKYAPKRKSKKLTSKSKGKSLVKESSKKDEFKD